MLSRRDIVATLRQFKYECDEGLDCSFCEHGQWSYNLGMYVCGRADAPTEWDAEDLRKGGITLGRAIELCMENSHESKHSSYGIDHWQLIAWLKELQELRGMQTKIADKVACP